MAMRLYTKDEFEADIKQRWNIEPTDKRSSTAKLWKTQNGKYITIPELDQYPDYWLDVVRDNIAEVESRTVPWKEK